MKKAFIIYGLGWVALIASFIIRVALPSYHEIAEDPQNIEDCYLYTDEKGIDELYSVSCHIYKDCCTIDYTISEDEGLIFG